MFDAWPLTSFAIPGLTIRVALANSFCWDTVARAIAKLEISYGKNSSESRKERSREIGTHIRRLGFISLVQAKAWLFRVRRFIPAPWSSSFCHDRKRHAVKLQGGLWKTCWNSATSRDCGYRLRYRCFFFTTWWIIYVHVACRLFSFLSSFFITRGTREQMEDAGVSSSQVFISQFFRFRGTLLFSGNVSALSSREIRGNARRCKNCALDKFNVRKFGRDAVADSLSDNYNRG